MDGAEIVVGARFGEYIRELFIGIERAGIECPGLGAASGGVRYVVVVDPGHLGARADRQLRRIEGEIVDDDFRRGALGHHAPGRLLRFHLMRRRHCTVRRLSFFGSFQSRFTGTPATTRQQCAQSHPQDGRDEPSSVSHFSLRWWFRNIGSINRTRLPIPPHPGKYSRDKIVFSKWIEAGRKAPSLSQSSYRFGRE